MTDSGSSIYQEDLAYIHDLGFGDLARGAAPFVIERLRSSGLTQGTVVELGCGSGILLAALSKAGYQVVGIDSSRPMLELARAKASQADLRCHSLWEAALPACSAVVATGEALSYESAGQSNQERLPSLVARVRSALTRGGVFLFDLILQLPDTVTQYRTWRTGDDWAALVEGTLVDSNLLARRIITFRETASGYRRNEETHLVRLFRREDIEKILVDSGFSVQIYEGYGKATLPPGRLLFQARKGQESPPART